LEFRTLRGSSAGRLSGRPRDRSVPGSRDASGPAARGQSIAS
jgi:hypothetical protein